MKLSLSGKPQNKHVIGSIKDLLIFSLPLLVLSFTTCLLGFFERLWSSQYSLNAVEASMSAIYVIRIFQMPCIALAMMGQVFVGQYYGAKELFSIGKCIWQLIWFSFLSMLVTVPLSYLAKNIFFKGIIIEHEILPYFYILVFSNFLFPLGAALTSFYLGRKKLKFVFLATIIIQLLNAGLNLGLIFGVNPWISPLGLKGAAFATLISQGLLCLILLVGFLQPSNRNMYGTHQWTFDSKAFWHYISPAFPRAFGRIVLLAVWAANAYVMTSKGEEHLFILSISGTISLFLSFIGDGTLQTMVILVSNSLGAKRYSDMRMHIRNGCIFLVIIGALLSIPLALFPDSVLSLFSLGEHSQGWMKERLNNTLFWVWIHTMIFIFNNILLSVLLATKDTRFLLLINLSTWITGYLPVYLGMNYLNISSNKFWLLASCGLIFSSCLYIWRISQKRWLQQDLVSPI